MEQQPQDPQNFTQKTEQALEQVGLGGLLDFSFNRFITVNIIKLLYILGIIVACFVAVVVILGDLAVGIGAFIAALIVMPILAIIWIIYLRVLLELLVVIFRIGENTAKLAAAQPQPGSMAAAPPMGSGETGV